MRYLTAVILIVTLIAVLSPVQFVGAQEGEAPAAVASASSIEGNWKGTVDVFGQSLGIILMFSEAEEGLTGRITIPAQGVSEMALGGVALEGTELRFALEMAGAEWILKVSEDGRSAEGQLNQAGMQFPTRIERLAEGEQIETGLKRPQTPKPPFPYKTREVEFASEADGAKLAGTLSIPEGDGPHPVVVFITGSGPQDRDETLYEHKPFLVLADDLARHGVASLRYDDRGVGGSEGDLSEATTQTFVGDVLGAIDFLKTLDSINADAIGLIGHSEGGLVAPAVAAESEDVAFIVLLAGTGVPGGEILKVQRRAIMEASGADAPTIARMLANQKKTLELVGQPDRRDELEAQVRESLSQEMPDAPADTLDELTEAQMGMLTSPWFRAFVDYDPRAALRRVTCPVLALNGSKDLQVVPSQNLPEIRAALEEAGNEDVTITELPGLNHLFQESVTGSIAEYAQIEQTMHPRVIELVREWVRSRAGLDP